MTQLAAAVNSTEELWTLDTLPTTQYVAVGDETVEVRASFPSQIFSLTGQATAPQIRVNRGVGGTTAASHTNGSALTPVYGLGGGAGGGGVTVDNQTDPPAEVTTLIAEGATLAGDEATLPPRILEKEGSTVVLNVEDGEFRIKVHDGDPESEADVAVITNDSFRVKTNPAGIGTYFLVETIEGGTEGRVLRIGWNDGLDIVMPNLPSVDPEVGGQLYTDGPTSAGVPKALMVSGGPAA